MNKRSPSRKVRNPHNGATRMAAPITIADGVAFYRKPTTRCLSIDYIILLTGIRCT